MPYLVMAYHTQAPFTPALDHLTPNESDKLLLLASQQYESKFPDRGDLPPIQDDEPGIDNLFLAASQ